MFDEGKFDVAIGGLVVTPARLTKVNFSNPCIDPTIAIVVEDHRLHEFKGWRIIDQEIDIRLILPFPCVFTFT
jgi:hypothetical protein